MLQPAFRQDLAKRVYRNRMYQIYRIGPSSELRAPSDTSQRLPTILASTPLLVVNAIIAAAANSEKNLSPHCVLVSGLSVAAATSTKIKTTDVSSAQHSQTIVGTPIVYEQTEQTTYQDVVIRAVHSKKRSRSASVKNSCL
jgi:hypothetical protein